MANLTFDQILKNIRNKVYSPVYFLMGEEPFFIDVIADYLEKQVLSESEKEFNLSILYGKETDIPAILGVSKRYPMMASHHLVIVREAQNVRNIELKEKETPREIQVKPLNENNKGKEKSQAEFENEILIKYFENPLKSTILVFCYKYKTIDGRRKVAKTILQNGVLFESKRIYENQLPGWIETYINRKNYRIEPKATYMLAAHLGTDLAKITNEVQKLFISLQPGSVITPDIIENNIGISKDFNIFELQDALGTLNKEKAYRIAKYFGDNQKANPMIMTLSMLYLFFQKLMLYHYTQDKTENGLKEALGINAFYVKNYQKAARNFSPERIEHIFGILRDFDLKIKGLGNRSADAGQLLTEMTFKILH